jgi:hypothetical protein
VHRRTFIKGIAGAAGLVAAPGAGAGALLAGESGLTGALTEAAGLTGLAELTGSAELAGLQDGAKPRRQTRPRGSEFVFARVRYTSGDWDFNPKVAANVLNSVVEYTSVPVYRDEVVITLDSQELFAFPFLFMTGHKLVRFSKAERENLTRYVERGGLLFSDDCNHDIAGLYAQSFEHEMRTVFGSGGGSTTASGEASAMSKIPNTHPLYRAFFKYPDGPPQTSHELNGWGDDMIHDYLKAITIDNRLAVLYSNKDYGCEWDYDWRNKRFQRDDNTRFAINIITYAMTA